MDIPHIPDEVEDKIEEEEIKAAKRRSTISPVKEDLNVGKDKTSQVSDCRHDQLAAAVAQWVRAFFSGRLGVRIQAATDLSC